MWSTAKNPYLPSYAETSRSSYDDITKLHKLAYKFSKTPKLLEDLKTCKAEIDAVNDRKTPPMIAEYQKNPAQPYAKTYLQVYKERGASAYADMIRVKVGAIYELLVKKNAKEEAEEIIGKPTTRDFLNLQKGEIVIELEPLPIGKVYKPKDAFPDPKGMKLAELEQAAESNPRAAVLLALGHLRGRIGECDSAKAYHYGKLALDAGFADGALVLGRLAYENLRDVNGFAVEKDWNRAREYLEVAAIRGSDELKGTARDTIDAIEHGRPFKREDEAMLRAGLMLQGVASSFGGGRGC